MQYIPPALTYHAALPFLPLAKTMMKNVNEKPAGRALAFART